MSDYGRKPLDETHAAAWQEGHDDGFRAGVEAALRHAKVTTDLAELVEARLPALLADAQPRGEP